MIDVAGRELEVGDIVACTLVGYTGLKLVKVCGFSPKKILVTKTHKSSGGELREVREHKFSDQVCFVRKSVV